MSSTCSTEAPAAHGIGVFGKTRPFHLTHRHICPAQESISPFAVRMTLGQRPKRIPRSRFAIRITTRPNEMPGPVLRSSGRTVTVMSQSWQLARLTCGRVRERISAIAALLLGKNRQSKVLDVLIFFQ
jgi:hypothetical protein